MTARIVFLFCLASMLAACAPYPIMTTSREIRIQLQALDLRSMVLAEAMAQEHCAQFDRNAEIVPEDRGSYQKLFKCVLH
jgi:hypothetical protein